MLKEKESSQSLSIRALSERQKYLEKEQMLWGQQRMESMYNCKKDLFCKTLFRREIIEAMVVSAHEVATNPAFSLLKDRERDSMPQVG